jgi:O-antigen/teichoic acid export membrane protein
MVSQPRSPSRWLSAYLHRAKSDTLVRNSLYIMASTVVTAGMGYIFWAIATRAFTRQQVGTGAAVISLCTTAALLTYLGSSATLIERLPSSERSSGWTATLMRVCLVTAGATALTIAAAIPLLRTSHDYRSFFSAPLPILAAVIGAAAWTIVNLFGSAFIAARRAGGLLSIQALVSASKVLFVLPLAVAGVGALGVVGAWAGGALFGIGVGVIWLIPRMELSRPPGNRFHRQTARWRDLRRRQYRSPRHRRPASPPSAGSVRHFTGQHLTSVGGSVTPLVLPVLVVLRLGAGPNAYFYVTWMVGGVFFIVSPSVSAALFAEGVRKGSDLGDVVIRALRVIAIMLIPAMLVMIIGGRLILGLFGVSYGRAGYGLLILLAISALPDAVSNVAVAVLRVTDRLGYSSLLNLGILATTLLGAWVLMPRLGIAGVGVAWLAVQVLGAIVSLPAYAKTRQRATIIITSPSLEDQRVATNAGIAQLIELAKQQSWERLSGPLP